MNNRARYDRLAPLYDPLDVAERAFKQRIRPKLFEGLSGRILDAGVGTGRNIPFYPEGAFVLGVDISPGMLLRAKARSERLDNGANLAAMDICELGLPDDSFDAVVASFLFGALQRAMQRRALAEIGRVCKPGGEIRILDYTYSKRPLLRAYMWLWLPWEYFVYGGTFNRHSERYLAEASLALIGREFLWKDMVRLLRARPA